MSRYLPSIVMSEEFSTKMWEVQMNVNKLILKEKNSTCEIEKYTHDSWIWKARLRSVSSFNAQFFSYDILSFHQKFSKFVYTFTIHKVMVIAFMVEI